MVVLRTVIGLVVQFVGVAGAIAVSDFFVRDFWGQSNTFPLNALPMQTSLILLIAFLIFWHKTNSQPDQQRSQQNPQIQADLAKAESLAVMRERARLARELHDTLGHTLTALEVQLELIEQLPPDRNREMRDAIQKARRLVKDGLSDVRRAVQALHPSALDVVSLPDALENLIENFRRDQDVAVQWHVKGEARNVPSHLMLPLYRAAQEGLTNIRKHAVDCSEVTIELAFEPDSIALTMENDGCKSTTTNYGYGLEGLCARAETLRGIFCAHPLPSDRFRLHMKLPG